MRGARAGAALLVALLVGLRLGGTEPGRPAPGRPVPGIGRPVPSPAFRLSPVAPEPAVPGRSTARSERLRRALDVLATAQGTSSRADPRVDEARWRAARAYAAGEAFGRARAHLRALLALGAGESSARARVELAHLARREGGVAGARIGYATALLDPSSSVEARDEALRGWCSAERAAGERQRVEELTLARALAAPSSARRARAWLVLVEARARRGHALGARLLARIALAHVACARGFECTADTARIVVRLLVHV